MKIEAPADGGLFAARALLLGVFVATLVSTSIAIGLEIASYILFMIAPVPRRRLAEVVRHPAVVGLLPLAAVIAVATLYGPASWSQALISLVAWRRLLLLPLAAAVFVDPDSKRLALRCLIVTCLVGAVASFATAALQISLSVRLDPGIVFHTYATQGLALSLAAIACMAALLRPEEFKGDRLLGNRPAMMVVLAVMVFDIVFVLWGRTGYLSIVVMSVAIVVFLIKGGWRTKVLAGLVIALCGAAILLASPHVRGRIADALNEIATVDQSPVGTRLGTRIVMWRNTVRMIRDHPILGVGTGGFQDGYRAYVQGVGGWQGDETGDPHNQFLKFQGEQGVIGLGAFLFFIVGALRCRAPSPYRELAAAGLLGWCAASLANSDFSTFAEGRLVFFWLGAMLGGPIRQASPAGS